MVDPGRRKHERPGEDRTYRGIPVTVANGFALKRQDAATAPAPAEQ
jgi:hypothetical protein